jgi:hypothetical protein
MHLEPYGLPRKWWLFGDGQVVVVAMRKPMEMGTGMGLGLAEAPLGAEMN